MHKQKPEILQQTILVHIDINSVRLEDNATSELSTDTHYNISETIFKLQNHKKLVNSDNTDM